MTKLLSSIVLLEGITHLEELPLGEFITTIESLKDKVITEKLDGANLWFGLDDNGLFTSREGKSPKKARFYDVSDYPMVANYNGFRAAHLALEKAEPVIKKYLQEGDMIEIEILFGRQPNTVTYGVNDKNFIVILRGVNDTPDDRVDALAKAVNNKTVTIESTIVSSPDGTEIELSDEKLKWEFTQVKPVSTDTVDLTEITGLVKELKAFMVKKNEVLTDMTNEEVESLSLNKVPKEQREEAKLERDKIKAIFLNKYKNPIKELLLGKFVRKIKPFLQDKNLHPSEDIGVEGVVVRDPVTGSQTKIVDKDVFTAINTFNSAARNNVSGLVRTTDQDAAIDMRGGAFGQAKIRIAELLGAKELALSSGVKRFVTKFKADSAETTATELAKSLNLKNFDGIRTKIAAILKNSLVEVDGILDGFKKEAGEYKLHLKTGKDIGITPEVMKRTLTAFAETKKDIQAINSRVRTANNPTELILALYGKTIESIFDGAGEVKESFKLLRSFNEDEAGGNTSAIGSTTIAGNTNVDVKSFSSAAKIATPEKKLFGNRAVVRRPRNASYTAIKKFPAPKPVAAEGKFSLMKSMNEDWAHVKDMKFATDVDDTASAKSDIEFNQLRNNVNIGDNVTQMDVNRYLDKAHDLNDEVDTVVFGMETDDGKIAKVYVNAAQADDFEKALADMLGKEDDLENVINDLASKFDIVDVEWPEGFVSSSGENIGDETAAPVDEPEYDEEGEPEIHMGLDGEEESTEDEPAADDTDDELNVSALDDEPAPEEENAIDDEDVPDLEIDGGDDDSEDGEESSNDDDSEELDTSGEEEAADAEGEEESDGDEPKPKKKKAKKDNTEESMQTLGQRFKDKVLAEAKKVNPKDKTDKEPDEPVEDPEIVAARTKATSEVNDLLKSFSTKQAKAILTLMISLGAPVKALKRYKAEIRTSIDGSAERYLKDSSFRMWTKKLLTALSQADEVRESFDDKLSNKYQHVIYGVLMALGMPEHVQATAQTQLLKGIRAKGKIAVANSNVRVYLLALANVLGVDSRAQDKDAEDDLVNEAVDPLSAITPLLTALGFDVNKNQSITVQATHKAKAPLNMLSRNTTLMNKLQTITQQVSARVKLPGAASAQPSNTIPSSAAPELASYKMIGSLIAEADDQGQWSIARMGSHGLMLKCAGLTIKVDQDESEKLKYILEKRKKGSVKVAGGKRFVFSPLDHGDFSVKRMDDDTDFPEGVILPSDQVVELMDMLSSL